MDVVSLRRQDVRRIRVFGSALGEGLMNCSGKMLPKITHTLCKRYILNRKSNFSIVCMAMDQKAMLAWIEMNRDDLSKRTQCTKTLIISRIASMTFVSFSTHVHALFFNHERWQRWWLSRQHPPSNWRLWLENGNVLLGWPSPCESAIGWDAHSNSMFPPQRCICATWSIALN